MNIQLLKNINYMVLAQLANYAMPLLLVPYLIRVLGIYSFGEFSVAQAVINVGIIIVQFGFNIYMTKHIAEKIKQQQTINSLISTAFILQLAIACCLIAIMAIINWQYQEKITQFMLLYSFVWLGQAMFPIWYFQGLQQFKQLAVINFLLRFITFICIILWVKHTDHFFRVAAVYVFSYLSIGLLVSFIIWRRYTFCWPEFKQVRALLNNTKGLFFSNIISVILINLPVFCLNQIVSKSEVGAFSAILRVVYAVKGLLGTSFQVLIPSFINDSKKVNTKKVVSIVLLILLVIVQVLLWGKEPLLSLLYGSKELLLDINQQYIILILSIIPGGLGTLFVFVFATYYGRFYIRGHVFIRVLVVAALLYYPSIQFFGGLGAALVILLNDILLCLLGRRVIRD